MAKRLTLVLLAIALVFFAGMDAIAGSWNIECRNESCVASSGALNVFWNSPTNNQNSGTLTGVEGIPLTIEDYDSSEKKMNKVFEHNISYKSSSEAGVRASGEQHRSGGHVAENSNSENLFSQKQSMSQSKTQGRKFGINYNLAFVKWLGDTYYGFAGPIKRYWGATEDILAAYNEGTIHDLVDQFFFDHNANLIDSVAVDAKINAENKDLVLTKYGGLTRHPLVQDPKERYQHAHAEIKGLERASAEEQHRISAEYNKNMADLSVVAKPGQTALELYRAGKKDLAFVKWLGDTLLKQKTSWIATPQDRYVVAMYQITTYGSEDFWKKQREDFEAAVAKKDPSVQLVTIEGSIATPIFAFVGLVVAAGAFGWWFWRRKQRRIPAEVSNG